jgi:tetratricopeptide (TPR) repeat protein
MAAGEAQHGRFLFARRARERRRLATVSRLIAFLGIAGFASLFPMSQARAASGYLKPAVSAKALRRAESHHRDGVEFYKRRRYRAALRKFAAAEEVCPELFSAGYHVALVHRKIGDEEAAIAQLRKLNARFPENIIAHNDLGVIYASKNEEDSERLALHEFETAVRNGEDLLQGKEEKVPQVRVDLAMAYANLAGLQLKSSRLTSAERNFRKSIEHYPFSFFGHFGVGNVLFAMKRLGEAKTAYRKAQRIEPNNPNVHIALAKCYLLAEDKNPRFAIAELKKVEEDGAPSEVFDLLGDAHALLGNTKQAAIYYRRYLTTPDPSPQALYKLGVLYYNEANWEEARKYLEKFLAAGPEEQEGALSTAYKLLGDIASEERDYERAVAHYLQGSKLRKAYLSCYYGLAESYFHLKRYEKAKECLALVLKGLPQGGGPEENQLREKAFALLKALRSQE